jgi:pimeloyl-ACP methyl ester carboxylesterase
MALHGITANGGAFAGLARLLAARGWRVLAPDIRGHGENPRAGGDFRPFSPISPPTPGEIPMF